MRSTLKALQFLKSCAFIRNFHCGYFRRWTAKLFPDIVAFLCLEHRDISLKGIMMPIGFSRNYLPQRWRGSDFSFLTRHSFILSVSIIHSLDENHFLLLNMQRKECFRHIPTEMKSCSKCPNHLADKRLIEKWRIKTEWDSWLRCVMYRNNTLNLRNCGNLRRFMCVCTNLSITILSQIQWHASVSFWGGLLVCKT